MILREAFEWIVDVPAGQRFMLGRRGPGDARFDWFGGHVDDLAELRALPGSTDAGEALRAVVDECVSGRAKVGIYIANAAPGVKWILAIGAQTPEMLAREVSARVDDADILASVQGWATEPSPFAAANDPRMTH